MYSGLNGTFNDWLYEWQARAEKYIKRDVGMMDGLLYHYWHGRKADRGYMTRPQILVKHQFNPALDLKRDWQGVWALTDRNIDLRDDIRAYFAARNEDSIDL
jgi:hypothetical protein